MKFAKSNTEKTTYKVPVIKIRMMSDEEWNRLAYRNALERRAIRNGTAQAVH